jgi:hypothetical protein
MMSNSANPLPKTGAASVQPQWVRCGKPNCRCAAGNLHGPYWYVFWRAGGRLCKRYIPRSAVDTIRADLATRRCTASQRLAAGQASIEAWRTQQHALREVEQWLMSM